MLDNSQNTTTSQTGTSKQWFQDAVIYQLHVRAFYDSNGDGIGDFPGLTEKLDYIQNLGVTTIWLLPFFVSPLRDDGYDIADYTKVHPSYGTIEDFEQFLAEAHARNLRVITEMVMNHTSDQHEWFQKSRSAKPGDFWRDFYVWSDTEEKYQQARIIFQDFERSNWTWDHQAQAYYWHRFYHHQPDLNFDYPPVHDAILGVLDFWLSRGVDGIRLDAVPYLYEREGTNCENLPETHAFLKKVRAHVDANYTDRMLLAEANQWPEDAAAYFGDGDECHMNFHFPLMPRLFMAIEREDRFPIIDILDQTPAIPENCQWGIFLRNHDELTLEMVTDEERDYMYRAYADDPRARVNLGIRRRLGPLLKDNRRKMELMNALLLSLPGTPVIYYGDEIAMGDNIFLGDRDGVRTPMQWNEDRNAGFSRANPQKLYLPVSIDAAYHYASRNVEVDLRRPHSMLWWMRRLIALRKQHPVFGTGSITILTPDNHKVLAFLRENENETILGVFNLSRFVQYTELHLSQFRGYRPVELLGKQPFPPIGELPYFLTMGPYAFYWFRLDQQSSNQLKHDSALIEIKLTDNIDNLFENKHRQQLENALQQFVVAQAWYPSHHKTIQRLQVIDVISLKIVGDSSVVINEPRSPSPEFFRILMISIDYRDYDTQLVVCPLVFANDLLSTDILGDRPNAAAMKVALASGESFTLCDATREATFWRYIDPAYLPVVALHAMSGKIQLTALASSDPANDPMDVTFPLGAQRNAHALVGHSHAIKLYRITDFGINPEWELGRMIADSPISNQVSRVYNSYQYEQSSSKKPITLVIFQQYYDHQGNCWNNAFDELQRYIERIESECPQPPTVEALPGVCLNPDLLNLQPPDDVWTVIGPYMAYGTLLGQRTAQLHLFLSTINQDAFHPEPFNKLSQRSYYQSVRGITKSVVQQLQKILPTLPEQDRIFASQVLALEHKILDRFQILNQEEFHAKRIRLHGDYQLEQILFTGKDFVIIDFEGNPDLTIGQRRIKSTPLRDVATLLHSLYTVTHVSLKESVTTVSVDTLGDYRRPWLEAWCLWLSKSFVQGYIQEMQGTDLLPADLDQLCNLLHICQLEIALRTLQKELEISGEQISLNIIRITQLMQ
ncbi:MAG: maltose alpha-D-glucosyltransferase [Zavarzinella sp.]